MSEMRARGFLTDREREFLQTGDDGGSNPRKLRQQIRERIRGCLADFAILYEHLESRDIEQLCDVRNDTFEGEFRDNYHSAMGLCYRLAAESGADPERLLWRSLQSAHRDAHQTHITNVDLRLRTGSRRSLTQSVEEKLLQDEELTDMELRALFENPLLIEEDFLR